MKRLVIPLALAAGAVFGAREYEWPQLPDGTPPDTEVTTNVVLHVNAEKLKEFSLKLEVANPSQAEVLVAVGSDADSDGDLSYEETDFVFGLDGPMTYLSNYRTGRLFTGVGDTIRIDRRWFDPSWNLAKIVKRGGGAVGEAVTETVANKYFVIKIR